MVSGQQKVRPEGTRSKRKILRSAHPEGLLSNRNGKAGDSNRNGYKYIRGNRKNAGNVIALPAFFIFLHLERGDSFQDILEFEEALCLSCELET